MTKQRHRLILCFLCFLLLCTSCASSTKLMPVQNEAFSITPEEFIERLNALVDEQNDSRYLSIPNFGGNGNEIKIDSFYLTLKLVIDSDRNVTEIKWHWDGERQGTGRNIGLYLSGAIYMITGSEKMIDTIISELDMMDTSSPGYDTSYTYNDVLFSYSTFGHGKSNDVTISIKSD